MKVSWLFAPILAATLVGGAPGLKVRPERGQPPAEDLPVSLEAALERGDLTAAVRVTEMEHRRVARDDRWEPLIEIGDAYYLIADRNAMSEGIVRRGHDAYEAALRNARRAQSLDGVLRVAEAYARLGDSAEAESSLRIAQRLAGLDPEATDDVRASAARFAELLDGGRR